MRAMSGAKSIVDVKIGETGERFGKIRIVRFFSGLESQVLEERHVAVLHVLYDFSRHVANRVVTENDRLMNQRVQIIADRTKRIFFNWFAFGPAKVLHQNRFPAMV